MTPKQQRFCDEYLVDLNATQAAIRSGYSEDTAKVIGCENLTKPYIKSYISERQKQLQEKTHITQEMVLAEYAKLAFFDIRKIFDDDGRLKPIQDIDDQTAGAITAIESYEEVSQVDEETFKQGINRKIKVSDKRAALDSICRVLGFNAPEKHEVTVPKRVIVVPAEDAGKELPTSESEIDLTRDPRYDRTDDTVQG